MTSADFRVRYASVTNTLFEHIEQDLLTLTTVLLDDDDELSQRSRPYPAPQPDRMRRRDAGRVGGSAADA